MHAAARLGIDSTPMEGVDKQMISQEFAQELQGYECELALSVGYHLPADDYNASLPKSRLPLADVVTRL